MRHLLPGETVVQRYQKVVSQRRFRAVLTDHRLLLVGRNAVEEVHLNAVSSMSYEARRRWGLVALGFLMAGWGWVAQSGYNGGSAVGAFGFGVILMMLGVVLKKHSIRVFASGREFAFRGDSVSLNEFLRDVRLQQGKFAGYRQAPPAIPSRPYYPIPQPFLPPTSSVLHRETIREIVKVPCVYCSSLVEVTASKCPACTAPALNGRYRPESIGTAPASRICPQCGAAGNASARFCADCGFRWPALTPAPLPIWASHDAAVSGQQD